MWVRKAVKANLVVIGLATLVLTTGLPTLSYAGTFNDAVTNVKVRALLLDKLGTDALGIHIEVDRGRVVLSGTVEKKPTQELAKEVALSVQGVHEVDNRIGIAPSTTARAVAKAEGELKDAILEARVKGRLLDQVGANAMRVEVEASEGTVSLRGAVPSESIRSTSLETARKTKGVRKVIDLITVKNRE